MVFFVRENEGEKVDARELDSEGLKAVNDGTRMQILEMLEQEESYPSKVADELDISKVTQDRSEPHRNLNTQGKPISLGGKIYERGLGTHASSTFYIHLNEGTKKFSVGKNIIENDNYE